MTREISVVELPASRHACTRAWPTRRQQQEATGLRRARGRGTQRHRPAVCTLHFLLAALAGLVLAGTGPARPARGATVVVTSDGAHGWFFAQEVANGTGSFVSGPATPPLGSGSADLTVDATGRMLLGTVAYAGTPLSAITNFAYSTYEAPTDGAFLAISLQLDVDYDLTDANTGWQGRLVFEPYLSGTVAQGTWQAWSPLSGVWWASGSPGNTVCPQSSPCTWSQVLANFPHAGIRSGNGVLWFKAGGPWTGGFDGNVDAFTIGISGSDTTYDFEPCPAVPAHVNLFVAPAGSDAGNDCSASASPCATIQQAVNQACAGDVVNVAAGTYAENVVVTQSVTIAGAGQGSTIVEPAVSNPNPCPGSSLCGGSASNVFLVQADGVTIHDLTVDGDNPGLTSGVTAGGADLDARNGIITNYYVGNVYDLSVYNTTVQNIYLRGIYSSSATSGNTFNFHNNRVRNVQADPASIGIFNFAGSGVMADNVVSDTNDALSSNWSMGTQYVNNSVTNSGSGVHSDNNGGSGGVADLLQGNQVSNCTAGGYGVWVFVPYAATTVADNTVTNCSVGLAAFGGAAPVTTTFGGNTVDGENLAQSIGIQVTTDQLGYGTGDVSTVFSNNFVTRTASAVVVQQPGSAMNLALSCNQIVGNASGITSDTAGVSAHNNSISGNGVGLDGSAIASGTLNAESNWWGCVTGPTTAGCDSVSGSVDYSSFATSLPACVSPGQNSLVLSRARLQNNSSSLRNNGQLMVFGLVNDNDTGGELQAQLLAQAVTLEVTDSFAFNAHVALTNCKLIGRRGKVRCRGGGVTATFQPIPGPLLYRMRVTQVRLGTAATGFHAPAGPVSVVLHEGLVDRVDQIGNLVPCTSSRQGRVLLCHEP